MNYYENIKEELLNNEINKRVKNYSINKSDLKTYYNVGKILNDAGKHYGEGIIKEYSKRLVSEVGKTYNERTLFRMKQFYNAFSNAKVSTLSTQLTWSHYTELLSIKNHNKLIYYLNICKQQNLSVRQLRQRIKSNEYERLDENTKNKLVSKEETNIIDFVKNPILIKNNNYEKISEKILQKLILEDIESFMNELGNSFCFVGSEYKIKLGNTYNYIDLLLFNYEYNCFVVIELKVTKLSKSHVGQIQVYMNYIDTNLKQINQNKTIGIIICKEEDKYIIKYCSDKRIISRQYELIDQ